ncbi:nucleotidyltransferase domain-containing protein [Candidatus Micrarchaeota archaeon]|nr:nucleotidyltransferase domain-containing protein [Candidatus Micrarchaeota archaeon]
MGKREDLITGLESFRKKLSGFIPVTEMILFGSRATGKAGKESDVDLLVVSPAFKNMKSARGKGLYDVWDLDYPVDFVCYTPEEFEKQKKQVSLVRMALKEGIEIA